MWNTTEGFLVVSEYHAKIFLLCLQPSSTAFSVRKLSVHSVFLEHYFCSYCAMKSLEHYCFVYFTLNTSENYRENMTLLKADECVFQIFYYNS
jgi:hypothetical protein